MQIPDLRNTLLTAGIACFLTSPVQADHHAQPFFGGQADVNYAKTLWTVLNENRLVGNDAINVFPFNGNQPHGAIQQVLDKQISINGRTSRVIVKRNHGSKGLTLKDVYSDPLSHLKAVTVMFKREAGYDPENLDWFWAKYTPAGKLAKNPADIPLAGRIGKDGSGGCITCHKAIGGTDMETLTEQ